MKKIPLLLVFLVVLSSTVMAATAGEILKSIPGYFTQGYETVKNAFSPENNGGEILIFLLIFCVVYLGAGFVNGLTQRLRVFLSIIISLISSVLIEGSLVQLVFETYTVFALFFLMGIPTFTVLYAIFNVLEEDTRSNNFIKLLMMGLLLFIILQVQAMAEPIAAGETGGIPYHLARDPSDPRIDPTTIPPSPSEPLFPFPSPPPEFPFLSPSESAQAFFQGLNTWLELAEIVIVLFMLVFAWKTVFPGGGSSGGSEPSRITGNPFAREGGRGSERANESIGRLQRLIQGFTLPETASARDIAQASMTIFAQANLAASQRPSSTQKDTIVNDLGPFVRALSERAGNGTHFQPVVREINRLERQLGREYVPTISEWKRLLV